MTGSATDVYYIVFTEVFTEKYVKTQRLEPPGFFPNSIVRPVNAFELLPTAHPLLQQLPAANTYINYFI
jgi:hypothetical protein